MKLNNIVNDILENVSVEVRDSYHDNVIDDYELVVGDVDVIDIVPTTNAFNDIVVRVYIETPKVSPNDLKGAARVRALYKWLYWLEAGRDIYDNKDAGLGDFWAAMCEWWSEHGYTIDIEGNWYDENGEEIA